MSVLVTGATGNVAGFLIPILTKAGRKVRAMVHSAAKGEAARAAGAEVVEGDYETPAALDRAFAGVETVLLVTPPHPQASRWASAGIAAAKRAGVKRLVRLSALKGDPNGPTDNTRQHGRTDKEVSESGIPYTILRPHFFMQNLFMGVQSIASEGVFYMGMGDGKMGMIDVRDIADAAARVLLDARWDGQIYELTGPVSISFHDAARVLTEQLGQPVKYVPVPPEGVAESIRNMGWGDWFADVMRDYSKAYAVGWGDFTTDWVEKIAGHPARSFEVFAQEVLVPAIGAARGSA